MSPETDTSITNMFEKIIDLLNSQNIKHKIIDHESINGSAANSSALSGTSPEQGAKALIMIVDGKNPIMVVLRGPDKVNKNALKKIVGSGNVRLATVEETQEITKTEIGTLPCIGKLFNLSTYVDNLLLKEKEIAFGTGMRTKTIMIDANDFKKLTNPVVGDFAKI